MTVSFALCDSKLSDKIKLVDQAHEWKGLFRKKWREKRCLKFFFGISRRQLEPKNRANAAERSIEWKSIVRSLNGAGEDRRDAENVAQAKSLIPLNLHKDAINIERILPLSLTLFSQFIDSSALAVIVYALSLRPPFYGFINLNLIPFPCFVFSQIVVAFRISFLPAFYLSSNMIYATLFHHREHNYCRIQSLFLNYFKHFKIIKRSARPRTEAGNRKRLEDVYDLHRKIAAGNGTGERYKWLLFKVPCRSI